MAIAHPSIVAGDRRSYRRGQILGLTIAEFFLLLAFLLLLVLALMGARWERNRGIIEALQRGLEQSDPNAVAEDVLDRLARAERRANEATRLESELTQANLDLLAAQSQLDDVRQQLSTVDSRLSEAQAPEISEAWSNIEPLMQDEDFIELIQGIAAEWRRQANDTTRAERQRYSETLLNIRGIYGAWVTSTTEIGEGLEEEFAEDLSAWNAEIDKERLVVRFNAPDVLFEQGQADLRPEFQTILESFCPRFLSRLWRDKEQIAEIRIEGHTSSEWRNETGPVRAYFNNMALSQTRTRAVLEFCLSLEDVGATADWARSKLMAVGLSSSHLMLTEGATEDRERSRRVEFRVVPDAARRIGDIGRELGVPAAPDLSIVP